jgi:hypothetical protein
MFPSLKNNKIAIGIVAFFFGALAGGAGVHDYDNADENATAEKTAPPMNITMKASDFRTQFAVLMADYVANIDRVIDEQHGDENAVSASASILYDNGTSIGKLMGSVYGAGVGEGFTTIWNRHLDSLMTYAAAGSKGDVAGKAAALASIDATYTKPLADYMSKINPKISESVLEGALQDHVATTAKMIDYHNTGDYTNEQAELDVINQHVERLFSTVASAIVQQYPNKFN